jgi:hypothetical protein
MSGNKSQLLVPSGHLQPKPLVNEHPEPNGVAGGLLPKVIEPDKNLPVINGISSNTPISQVPFGFCKLLSRFILSSGIKVPKMELLHFQLPMFQLR